MIAWIATLDRTDRGWFQDGEYRVIPKDTIRDIARLVWSTAGSKEWYFGEQMSDEFWFDLWDDPRAGSELCGYIWRATTHGTIQVE